MKIILEDGREILPAGAQKEAINYVLNHYRDSPKKITLDGLYEIISGYLQVNDFANRIRQRHLVYPRQIFSMIANKSLGYSLKEIGVRLGGLDHTSVLHSIERLKMLLACEEPIRKDLDNICALVGVINPMVYQTPKRPEVLHVVPLGTQKQKIVEKKTTPFIRPKADHTNRNYLAEYGV